MRNYIIPLLKSLSSSTHSLLLREVRPIRCLSVASCHQSPLLFPTAADLYNRRNGNTMAEVRTASAFSHGPKTDNKVGVFRSLRAAAAVPADWSGSRLFPAAVGVWEIPVIQSDGCRGTGGAQSRRMSAQLLLVVKAMRSAIRPVRCLRWPDSLLLQMASIFFSELLNIHVYIYILV